MVETDSRMQPHPIGDVTRPDVPWGVMMVALSVVPWLNPNPFSCIELILLGKNHSLWLEPGDVPLCVVQELLLVPAG